jgi:hypothetical protein
MRFAMRIYPHFSAAFKPHQSGSPILNNYIFSNKQNIINKHSRRPSRSLVLVNAVGWQDLGQQHLLVDCAMRIIVTTKDVGALEPNFFFASIALCCVDFILVF